MKKNDFQFAGGEGGLPTGGDVESSSPSNGAGLTPESDGGKGE